MATLCITSLSFPLSPPLRPLRPPMPPSVAFPHHRINRRSMLVTRAGPSTSTYVLAAVLPLSLLAVTIFTSIKIADKLDRDFLEDLAINLAIKEADEEDADDVDDNISLEEIVQEPVLPRTRNRPKREI